MKFGQVEDPSKVDFTLPKDHSKTKEILKQKGFLSEQNMLTLNESDSLIQLYLSQIKSLDSLDAIDSVLNFSLQL